MRGMLCLRPPPPSLSLRITMPPLHLLQGDLDSDGEDGEDEEEVEDWMDCDEEEGTALLAGQQGMDYGSEGEYGE